MAKERANGKKIIGDKKAAAASNDKGKGKETSITKKQQRKPKVEVQTKKKQVAEVKTVKGKKNQNKKVEEVVTGKRSRKKTEEIDEEAEERANKTSKAKGEAAANKEVAMGKTKAGATKMDDKKKGSTKKMDNNSSFAAAAAAEDEEAGDGGIASCCFPMSRVRRLMRLEGGNANVTISGISSEAVFLVNKASEMFLEKFVEDSYGRGMKKQNKSLQYKDLSTTVHTRKRYEFLSDFVPEKLKAEDALKARTLVET